ASCPWKRGCGKCDPRARGSASRHREDEESRMTRLFGNDAGFTLLEMLVAVAIMLAVTGATFSLMNPAHGVFAAQREEMDMQQRLRIGIDSLYKDLLMAGSGQYSGAINGSLGNYFAAIMPFRVGNMSPDPVGSFFSDRITIVFVPSTAAQTTIRDPVSGVSSDVRVN